MLLIALKYFVERKLAGRRVFKQVSRELNATSDRELADIGLSRCDVYPIAARAARDAEDAARAKAASSKKADKALTGIGAPPQVYY